MEASLYEHDLLGHWRMVIEHNLWSLFTLHPSEMGG